MYYLYLLLFYGTQLVFDLFFNDFLLGVPLSIQNTK